jgi:multisubunit Na+/H+ antiporter MnhG subunit
MSEHVRDRGLARRRLAKLTMTLGAWLVAFAVVMALLTLLGDELQSIPLALRALVLSGVLVSLMINLVMPVLSVAIARWLPSQPREPRSPSRSLRQTSRRPGAGGSGSGGATRADVLRRPRRHESRSGGQASAQASACSTGGRASETLPPARSQRRI